MNSRERLTAALEHLESDHVPVDFGATSVTGMHVSVVSRLRDTLIGDTHYRVKVIEPYQMLGEIDDELREILGIDVIGLPTRKTMFGFENQDWKPMTLYDGTNVLVPKDFQITLNENGDWLIYPEGDTSVPPSAFMPKGGDFFDSINRQPPFDEDHLNPAENTEEFGLLTEEDLAYYRRCASNLKETKGAIFTMPGAAFGDIALVPAPWMKHPKGIRDVAEWYVSTASRKDYVHQIFEHQCAIAEKNLELVIPILKDKVQAVFLTGTDFGTQRGLFISLKTYRELYKPFHQRINRIVHKKTHWKTFIHTCGGVFDLIPDLIEAGFDILNPVQCSAVGMDPQRLKTEFGKQITFWGGGINTQKTMVFGTPDEVYRKARERIEIFGEGGGYVFDAIHNIQAKTPTPNLLALFTALKDTNHK